MRRGVGVSEEALLIATVICGLGLAAPSSAAERLIDIRRSTVTVRVFAPAIADALEDHHLIQAPLSEGTVDDAIPHFQIVIDGSRLRVLDPGRSARERRQLQSRMLGPDVLDVNRFRWISFHSVTIEQLAGNQWRVLGELGLHGTIRPLTMNVAREGDRYKGSVTVRQSDYGIVPVSIAGGVLRVRDDIEIDFDIVVTGRLAAMARPACLPLSRSVRAEDSLAAIPRLFSSG